MARGQRNQIGQTMGRKGQETRRRLIDATVNLLSTTQLRDLRVADIAREAGSSPATFYVYFADVPDAVLAALSELTLSPPELLAMIDVDWSRGDPIGRALAIVKHYVDAWQEHNALYRVRNLASDEGDLRFRRAREESVGPLLAVMAAAIDRAIKAGWVTADIDATSSAGILMAMLERFAATIYLYERSEEASARMRRSAAELLAHMLGPAPSWR